MTLLNKQIKLAKRPEGLPKPETWTLEENSLREINEGEILIKNHFLSIDPAMRGWINSSRSYIPPVQIGEVMRAGTVGEIIKSKNKSFELGTFVSGWGGVQEFTISDGLGFYKVDVKKSPPERYIGTLGMPGMTAYFGILDEGKIKKDDTVLVSGAAGAVGSIVGQIAKIKGCKVIGIAGGSEKCSYVRDQLGFDNCIDYKDEYFIENLNSACNNGIDIYFENVGGPVSKTVAPLLNNSARIPVCGFISQYNEDNILESDTPFKIFGKLKPKPFHRFFVVTEWMDEWDSATHQLTEYILNNDIKYKETITKGFENAPQALRDVLTGKNFGKQLIEV